MPRALIFRYDFFEFFPVASARAGTEMRVCDAAIAFTLIQVFSGNAREEIQMLELGKGIGHQVDSLLTRSVAALLPQLTRRFCEAAVREGGEG